MERRRLEEAKGLAFVKTKGLLALDESTKKLTAWSKRKHQELVTRLSDIEGELMGSLDFQRKPISLSNLLGH